MSIGGIQDPPYAYFENDLLDTQLFQGKNYNYTTDSKIFTKYNYTNSNGICSIDTDGIGLPYWECNNYGEVMINQTKNFLQTFDASSKPFYIHFSSHAIHIPWSPPNKFLNQPVNGTTSSSHGDMLVLLDYQVKELVNILNKYNVLNDTILVFVSDNGGQKFDSSAGYRGFKGSIYEGGHRVPAIISYPNGNVKKDNSINDLASITDLFQTIADLAKVSTSNANGLDSISFKSRLNGTSSNPPRKELYIGVKSPQNCARTYRRGSLKLALLDGGSYELYDLSSDPRERVNLVNNASYLIRVNSMKANLSSHFSKLPNCPIVSGFSEGTAESDVTDTGSSSTESDGSVVEGSVSSDVRDIEGSFSFALISIVSTVGIFVCSLNS